MTFPSTSNGSFSLSLYFSRHNQHQVPLIPTGIERATRTLIFSSTVTIKRLAKLHKLSSSSCLLAGWCIVQVTKLGRLLFLLTVRIPPRPLSHAYNLILDNDSTTTTRKPTLVTYSLLFRSVALSLFMAIYLPAEESLPHNNATRGHGGLRRHDKYLPT